MDFQFDCLLIDTIYIKPWVQILYTNNSTGLIYNDLLPTLYVLAFTYIRDGYISV